MNYKALVFLFTVGSLPPLASPVSADQDSVTYFDAMDDDDIGLFLNSIHTREICVGSTGSCEVPLQKRVEDFLVVVRGEKGFTSDDVIEAASEALVSSVKIIEDATGLSALWDAPTEPTNNFVFITFINEDVLASDPDGFITARIAPPSLSEPLKRKRLFLEFLDSGLPCMYFTSKFEDGVIRDSQIWIRVDLSSDVMRRCIAEELVNSMGVDDGTAFDSIFDWPPSKQAYANNPLSLRHIGYLALLYDPSMKPGQLIDESRQILNAR